MVSNELPGIFNLFYNKTNAKMYLKGKRYGSVTAQYV
jgi:hypothetical protein